VARGVAAHGVRPRGPVQPDRPAAGWGSLTASELRVVRLVARGATNRDAAEQLFLSPHTVSSHLRHAFAKLDIHSRIELTRVALRGRRRGGDALTRGRSGVPAHARHGLALGSPGGRARAAVDAGGGVPRELAAGGGKKATEHGLHPRTYRPRKQYAGTQ